MPPLPLRVGLLGCGVVGTGLLGLLGARDRAVAEAAGGSLRVTRIAVRDPSKRRDAEIGKAILGTDPTAVAAADDVDVVVELMGGVDAAHAAVRRALELGRP